jgi:calcium release-activated calcium channel protein 1
VVDAVFGSYDLKNAKQWRDEDLQFREQEKQWREDALAREYEWRKADLARERRVVKLEAEKRAVDARHKQLTALSQLAALLAAFSMVTIVEVNIPDDLNRGVLLAYGLVVCFEFIFMLLAMLICTLLLLAVTRFVTHTLEGEVRALSAIELDLVSPFSVWWLQKCEHEWLLAYRLFRWGASLFLTDIALLAWVQFRDWAVAAGCMSAVCVLGILYFELRVASRWRYLVKAPDPMATPAHHELAVAS